MLEGDTTPRPALPTINGDTGLWFVPTAETLPAGKWSVQRVSRELRPPAGSHRRQPDRSHRRRRHRRSLRAVRIVAPGASRPRRAVRRSSRAIRCSAACRRNIPYVRRGWSGNARRSAHRRRQVEPDLSSARGDAMSLAPRVMVKFPSGSTWASTNDWDGHLDLVASREFGQQVRTDRHARRRASAATPTSSACPTASRGASARRSRAARAFRALVEWHGEFVIKDNTLVHQAAVRCRGRQRRADCSARFPIRRTSSSAASGRRRAASSCTRAVNYSSGTEGRVVGGIDIDHSAWGLDLRVGWHPGRDAAASARAADQGDDDGHQYGDVTPAPPPPRAVAEPAADGDGSAATRAWSSRARRRVRGAGDRSGRRSADLPVDRAAGSFSPTDAAEHDVHGAADRKVRSP